jgi:hypothetical protein
MQMPFGDNHAGLIDVSIAYAFAYWFEKRDAFAPQQTIDDKMPFCREQTVCFETHTSIVLLLAAALEGTSRRPLTSERPFALQQETDRLARTPHATTTERSRLKLADRRAKLLKGADATIAAHVEEMPP